MQSKDISFRNLQLDPDNPRVPETVGKTQSELITHIYENGALQELAYSFLDNGYFDAERLIVRPIPDSNDYVVVEGNRRLATLLILHSAPVAEGMRLTDDPPSERELQVLTDIPALVLGPGEEVDQYLAYRHIGGLKTWSPEAKARFIKTLVDRAVVDGEPNIFRAVGRQVGSNAQGVRTPFLALAVLEHGRDEMGLQTKYVQYERFGVWIRCMTSVDIRSFVSLGDPRTHKDVLEALAGLNPDALEEVVSDLTPRDSRKAVLRDSRDVTDYGRVLSDPGAHRVLRTHDDLDVAKQIIRRQALPDRVARVATDVGLLMDEVNRLESLADDEYGQDFERQTDRLFGSARSLRAAIKDLLGR